jgi:hypothetical protein
MPSPITASLAVRLAAERLDRRDRIEGGIIDVIARAASWENP